MKEAAAIELDIELPDGRVLHAYQHDVEADTFVLWHHGTPNIGAPPLPLFTASARLGLGWFSYDRPGYGGSTPLPGRDVASAAVDAAAAADALKITRFAVVGHSGGGPHALACAALMPGRVIAAVIASGLPPFSADGLDWFAGMVSSGEASLRAALDGPDAKERYETSGVDTILSSSHPISMRCPAHGPGSRLWSVRPLRPGRAGSSPRTLPTSHPGVSIPPRSQPLSFSCMVVGTGSCPPLTGSGSPSVARQESCGCHRTTATSRFSTRQFLLLSGFEDRSVSRYSTTSSAYMPATK